MDVYKPKSTNKVQPYTPSQLNSHSALTDKLKVKTYKPNKPIKDLKPAKNYKALPPMLKTNPYGNKKVQPYQHQNYVPPWMKDMEAPKKRKKIVKDTEKYVKPEPEPEPEPVFEPEIIEEQAPVAMVLPSPSTAIELSPIPGSPSQVI